MNHLKATVTNLKKFDGVSEIEFETPHHKLSMVALEINDDLKTGSKLILQAKATNIALATQIEEFISISNQLHVNVVEVEYGEILCSVKLQFEDTLLESIISKKSASKMDIKVGNTLIALIKASDLSIVSFDRLKGL